MKPRNGYYWQRGEGLRHRTEWKGRGCSGWSDHPVDIVPGLLLLGWIVIAIGWYLVLR